MTTAPHTAQRHPRARETARRRPAYAAIDAAYYAGAISEAAKNLGKWQVRVLCGMGTSFGTTQADQAQQFICPRNQRHLSRRHIIRLNQELEAAGLIWREEHGTGYRTYITEYVPQTIECSEDSEADDEQRASEVQEPTYAELRRAIDQALVDGEIGRAAMLEFQAAMLLARQSNIALPALPEQNTASTTEPFFDPPNGDNCDTTLVTRVAPTPIVNKSTIPYGDSESSVCTHDGDDQQMQQQSERRMSEIPDTEATRLLTSLGVEDRSALLEFSAAPLELIQRAEQRRDELGYSPGLIVHILRNNGRVWNQRGTRQQDTPGSVYDDEATYLRTHTCGTCGEVRAELVVAGRCYACGTVQGDACAPTEHPMHEASVSDALVEHPVLPVLARKQSLSEVAPPSQTFTAAGDAVTLETLWATVIARVNVPPDERRFWLTPTTLLHLEGDQALVGAPNIFVHQEIEDHYLDHIYVAAQAVLGYTVQIRLIIQPRAAVG